MSKTEGFIYALSNPAMPGLFKIGHTLRDPRTRGDELYRSSACPMPFRLLAYAYVSNAPAMERTMHRDLAPFRHNSQREFFRCKSENWLALAMLRHPAAMSAGADANVMLDLGSASWLDFDPWDETVLDARPAFAHPDLQDPPRWNFHGISWPILDRARFCSPVGEGA